ncbi:PqqD family protein, HPr-rel-A system [Sphingomonas gellani]|uniref:PqqD family protein, HPr-rel-A system n=1 Tax=Sphingomonas gellani TaxID=1166340 RepID=A0A1H8FXJ0_9SPHN|nr:HPr-rel-A system PqqD family peptide chaperone [Sphingomonas gellani]SEN35957.1 PqqD family protein, HPr-rel-A system [Sphingomonas gellani]
MRFRAAPADALLQASLDPFTAVFHRPSGQTHLLVSPAPEMLAALADGPLSLSDLHDALAAAFQLEDAEGLADRMAELVAAGLVTAEPAA